MNALILAAGFGTRLRPFTEKFPKPLVPVNGIPLTLYTLAFLKKNGIRNVVMNLHHLGEAIPKLLGNGAAIGMRIRYSREKKILGTGGGIKKILRSLPDGDLLIINGDVITDFDIKGLLTQHRKSRDVMTMALFDHPQKEKFGLISSKGKTLTSFVGQPPPGPKDKQAMYASYHVLTKKRVWERLQSLPDNEKFCIIRDVYIPQILAGRSFGAFKLKGFWAVCDSLTDVAEVEREMIRSRFRLNYQNELKKIVCALEKNTIYRKILLAKIFT